MLLITFISSFLISFLERLRRKWQSPIYAFFDFKVEIGYDTDGRKFHFFRCSAKKCLNHGLKGVHHYQDSQDRSATSNLKTHASKCFGDNNNNTAFGLKASRNGDSSIFAAFAHQGQQPVKVTVTNRINVRWCWNKRVPRCGQSRRVVHSRGWG